MKKYVTGCIFLLAGAAALFSHAMFLDLVEPGVFQVEYDDAGFTKIQEGVVDEKGFYKFDPALTVMTAEASDGAGHIAYWEAAADGGEKPDAIKTGKTKRPSKIPTVLTVLNTCALVYLFFEFRAFKKKMGR